MKTLKFATLTAGILAGAAAIAFAPNSVSAGESSMVQSAAAESGSAAPSPAQIGRGAKAWAVTCSRCHNLRDPNDFGDKDWDVIVNHMRVVGPLPGQVAEDIKAFLKASN